jgi:hypothetical protein
LNRLVHFDGDCVLAPLDQFLSQVPPSRSAFHQPLSKLRVQIKTNLDSRRAQTAIKRKKTPRAVK